MEYAQLPAMVQFALADVEAHTHLERVEQAARMWRDVARELRDTSDALGRELDRLRPEWTDGTGTEFAARAQRCRAAVDEVLGRITAARPWVALDDLAAQLLLTRGKVAGTVEQGTAAGHAEAAGHLGELDRYFLAAAEAVLAAAGGDQPAGCCAPPGFVLTGDTAPPGPPGAQLPPGSVSMPGLVAVPAGGWRTAPGAGGAPARGGRAEPHRLAGGSRSGSAARRPRAGSGGIGSGGAGAGGAGAAGAAAGPARIERAAHPVPLTGAPPVPQPPQPPDLASGAKPATPGTAGAMVPPMMMPPMIPGTTASTTGRRSGVSPVGEERRTRAGQATPGVPARLRGRSAVADPAAAGYRPVVMSGKAATPPEPETLDREVWQVANPGAVSPLKPEVPEPEPRRVRRPRV
ncbi:hypothetical protein L1857_18780 [Amycolatopsis thermalba]|uniref:Uncharacterized protein n=1 Tax=Amycolatopsis thermalba TaxID=944492 RepID=A0ABY4NXA7_9PSEU|nr:hypothetical protein [Amycolatopsis thermalba]UQS24719.1 hypothetical protein L1857_18780 [Amycolatopsis thermalba]